MRAEVARFSPGDVDGFERFMQRSEEICRIGFEQLGDVPFNSLARHGAHRAAICCGSGLSQRLRAGLEIFPATSACARPSAFIRC